MTTKLKTSAKTSDGIARAYVRQYGSTYRSGPSCTESTRDHSATQEADGSWTIWGCTGSPSDPRGSVRLATGVVIEE